ALQLGLAVDDLRFGIRFGILVGGLFARFGLELALLNLLLFQRQGVLHSIRFAFGLHHLGFRVAFRLLHLLRGFSFGLQLGDLYLLLLDLGIHRHLVVLLLFQQERLE